MKLLRDLLEYAEGVYTDKQMELRKLYGDDSNEPVLNQSHLQRCKNVLQKRNGVTVKTDANIIQEVGLRDLIKESQEYMNKDKKLQLRKYGML